MAREEHPAAPQRASRLDDTVQDVLRARIRALEAQLTEAHRLLEAEKHRADRAEAALKATRVQPRRAAPARLNARWVEHDTGHFTCTLGAAKTAGEKELLELAWPQGWLVVGGLEVADSAKTREVDALVISPHGLAVVEQKDVRRSGRLTFSPNGPPLLDGDEVPYLAGALAQARLPAQILASALQDARVAAGFVLSVLAIRGNVTLAQDRVGSTHLSTMRSLVAMVRTLFGPDSEDRVRVGTAEALIVALGLPQAGLPPLSACGFHDSAW
ncbi:nuclease-related domain-containing protein [Nocardioides alcanivorans]|uniref:nuclease-related domain-containing protein n=1 Tax=Nocardioides alcanivorans TaxID=2897352 RepID=UPI001F39CA3D|nr:nuclease-related domain-containing protein [Nocardioides alcanivorans]